ncbi:MAG: hypothetical protein GX640_22825, partial [Fibrobacter sp.]|nr:hypothetical protein [Fibrobacter sp.]
PLRIPVSSFIPGKSQRRLIRQNSDIEVIFSGELKNPDLIYSIYEEHSLNRFHRKVTREEFEASLCTQSCPTLYSLYYLKKELVGIGFIDCSSDALSSVYFVYKSGYSERALGNFSIIHEIRYALEIGKKYYYLGYYIEKCSRMVYKSRFYSYEILDWNTKQWIPVSKKR